MTDEKKKEAQNGQMQIKGEGKEKINTPETPPAEKPPEILQGGATVKSQKPESEFLSGFTRTDATVSINDRGSFSVDGALPQLNRKPVNDKTANGLHRINY